MRPTRAVRARSLPLSARLLGSRHERPSVPMAAMDVDAPEELLLAQFDAAAEAEVKNPEEAIKM